MKLKFGKRSLGLKYGLITMAPAPAIDAELTQLLSFFRDLLSYENRDH